MHKDSKIEAAGIGLFLLLLSPIPLLIYCHDDKPVVTADPDFANCSADKSIVENGCLKDAGTRADFDDCIARVRKSCVDGGH